MNIKLHIAELNIEVTLAENPGPGQATADTFAAHPGGTRTLEKELTKLIELFQTAKHTEPSPDPCPSVSTETITQTKAAPRKYQRRQMPAPAPSSNGATPPADPPLGTHGTDVTQPTAPKPEHTRKAPDPQIDALVRSEMKRLSIDGRIPSYKLWDSERNPLLPTLGAILYCYNASGLADLAKKFDLQPPLSSSKENPS